MKSTFSRPLQFLLIPARKESGSRNPTRKEWNVPELRSYILSLNIYCALVIKHILIHRYFLFYQVIIKLVRTVKKVRISKHINYALHVFWCSINVICTDCSLSDWFIFPLIKPKFDNKFSGIYLNETSDCCSITTLRKKKKIEFWKSLFSIFKV